VMNFADRHGIRSRRYACRPAPEKVGVHRPPEHCNAILRHCSTQWKRGSAVTELPNGAARMGNSRWRRLTEERTGGAKSVFHFDVQGSVAKSTHDMGAAVIPAHEKLNAVGSGPTSCRNKARRM
jgi:hypothetical protein